MKRSLGFTLIEMMLVVAILAALAAIVIPNAIRSRITANETFAKAHLNTIATAIEQYGMGHNGYPTTTTQLLSGAPPYLNVDFFNGSYKGYQYQVIALGPGGYEITAVPAGSSQGLRSYTISTGYYLRQN